MRTLGPARGAAPAARNLSPQRSARPPARRVLGLVAGLLASAFAGALAGGPAWAGADPARYVAMPEVAGHQLLSFFDARQGRVTYLTISAALSPAAGSPDPAQIFVEVAFYPRSLGSRLGERVLQIGELETITIDPTDAEFGPIAGGEAGLVVVTPVVGPQDRRPQVPDGTLMGSFTIVNTALGAGFGETIPARFALGADGALAAAGSIVDGSSVAFQRIAPVVLVIAGYFNPKKLSPPEDDGNRVLVTAFDDQYGDRFDVKPLDVTLSPRFATSSGSPVTGQDVAVGGVLFASLQELAQPEQLDSAGFGSLYAGTTHRANIFGFFSESLGTYAAGQRLTAISVSKPSPVAKVPAARAPDPPAHP